ncbi:DUF4304 domain-containing protein [Exilibacterium tricleocarpae]|uniref:DUF4304 domain-containing protein n=1 Tax=Exilibacterium tricleocarpae TaxID=2591008 RepID=A0A545SPL9_9GAMM|nr:DUF4304 domain-containing protein [Exilibacterium tricleocarpae]TQV66923.1 DUF4304 domain-containing protein [Exilibacterium tricleocarpae]
MLEELIRLFIAPFLKRIGFKKKGMTWNREANGVVHVIDIQPTRPRENGSEPFTINIGIFMNELWQLFWGKDAPQFIKEEDCYPRFRLGYLLSEFDPKCRDKWWDIQSQKEIETVWKELETLLIGDCLPFFNRIESASDVLDVSINAKPSMPAEKLSHAILLNMAGRKAESDQLISDFCSDPHWGARAKEIAKRLTQSS